MHVEIISGSPRKNSLTRRLALHLQKSLKSYTEHEAGLIDLREWNLPHIDQVFTSVETTPAEFRPLAKRFFEADAFILVSPEYNGSYSPAMKNLLDHFPKQHHKIFAIATASPGAMGGIRASQQMQLLIMGLFGVASPYMLITPAVDKKFDEEGNLLDESFQNSIDVFLKEFLWLSETISDTKTNELAA